VVEENAKGEELEARGAGQEGRNGMRRSANKASSSTYKTERKKSKGSTLEGLSGNKVNFITPKSSNN